MKRIKIMMMIAVAIFMGTTFTSCLNGDNERVEYDWVVIEEAGMYGLYVTTDAGVSLNIANSSAMELSLGGDRFYPKRAAIYYTLADGEEKTKGKTELNVVFKTYALIPNVGEFAPMKVESKTPFHRLVEIGCGSNYVDVILEHYYSNDTKVDHFSMFADRAEGSTLYLKVVDTQELESLHEFGESMFSFPMPSKQMLQLQFPELTMLGSTGDSINVKIIAEGGNSEVLEKGPMKIKLR